MEIELIKEEEPFEKTWYYIWAIDGDNRKIIGCKLDEIDAVKLYEETCEKAKDVHFLGKTSVTLKTAKI